MINANEKFRMHMGCGEPLKSRSSIRRAMTADIVAKDKAAAAGDACTETRREGKRKS